MAWIIAVREWDRDIFSFYSDGEKDQMERALAVDMKDFPVGYLAEVKQSWGDDDESS